MRVSLVRQSGKYSIVGSHDFGLIPSSDLGMNFATVRQYLLSGFDFTDLQEYARGCCYG